MAWTSLTFAYGSVLTSAKMTQMYDNFAAMAAGAAGAPSITRAALDSSSTIGDATGTTRAVGTNNTQLATTAFVQAAEFVNNDVGSLAVGEMTLLKNNGSTVADGATIAGSSLLGGKFVGGTWNNGSAPSGTWRNISGASVNLNDIATFQRIA